MKTTANFNRDDIVTIAEILDQLGPNPPHRDALHKAVKRGTLKKMPNLAHDRIVRFRWGDIVDYMDSGRFEKVVLSGKRISESDASPQLGEDTAPIIAVVDASFLTVAKETPADSELIEVVPVEIESGEGATSELKDVEQLVFGLSNFTENEIINTLILYSNRAKMCANEALAVGARALAFAWACGTILNKIKTGCGHGNFSSWLKGHLEPLGLSSRTCQRYMKLARAWPHLCDLVESRPGLKKAYEACGIIQESDSSPVDVEESGGENTAQASENPRPKKSLIACVLNLQERLSHSASMGEILTPEDLDKIGGIIDELTCFYKQLQQ